MTEDQIRQSILERADIETRWAEALLAPGVRADIEGLHVFWQSGWDLAASDDRSSALRELEARREVLRSKKQPGSGLWRKFFEVVKQRDLPSTYFSHYLAGIDETIQFRQPRTYHDLEQHLSKTLGSVAAIVAKVLGATGQASLKAATNLGVAIGLTRILERLESDLSAGRVYLPASLMREVHVTPADFTNPISPPAKIVLAKLATQAAAYYESAEHRLDDLPNTAQKAAGLMLRVNRARLQAVTDADFEVAESKPSLSNLKKRAIWLQTKLGRNLAD